MLIALAGYSRFKKIHESFATEVYSAIRNADKKQVIIKRLRVEFPSLEEIAQFKQEFEITQSLDKAPIAHALSLEKLGTSMAIVFEKIEAPSLKEILESKVQFSLIENIDLFILITKAVEKIHEVNVIHKDLNPSNLLYNYKDKQVTIVDFGLSINTPNERVLAPPSEHVAGTFAYLSPEQSGKTSREIDYRSDYYSMGIMFYQCLTSHLPFEMQDPMQLLYAHMTLIAKSPHEVNEKIPEGLSNVIMKLINKNPEERYQSEYGIIADLNYCKECFLAQGEVKPFNLGRQDIFSKFQIPEKLYGRDDELKTLFSTYQSVLKGEVRLLFVTGYSGIGKTSFVNEIYKPVIRNQGYFISGKFDQYNQNSPYEGFLQAFKDLIYQIIKDGEERIALFKKEIEEELGDNINFIQNIIPNLQEIFKVKPISQDLPPSEIQSRIAYGIQGFIKAVSRKNHPLVIFLDDVQWADVSSLKLLRTIVLNPEFKYLFIIVSYRSNEVNAAHPLMMEITELEKKNIAFANIELSNLTLKDYQVMLADTLHRDEASVALLAKICHDKTSGNPFFLIRLLDLLYKKNYLYFDNQKNNWNYNLADIQSMAISHNVVEFLIENARHLSPVSKKVISIAACVGNKFELKHFESFFDIENSSLNTVIKELINDKFIIKMDGSFFGKSFQFAHDKIQQAIYCLISKEEKHQIHLQLARVFFKNLHSENDILVFETVNQYNVILDEQSNKKLNKKEMKKICQLNLTAARLSKKSAAFESALNYIRYALRGLGEEAWNSDYDLTLAIHKEAVEISYLYLDADLLSNSEEAIFKNAKNNMDKLEVIRIKALSLVAKGNAITGLNYLTNSARAFGVDFPSNPTSFRVLIEILKIRIYLFFKPPEKLVELPKMTEDDKKGIARLIEATAVAAFFSHKNLFAFLICKAFWLFAKYGNHEISPFFYCMYGVIIWRVFGNIALSCRIGEAALAVSEKNNFTEGEKGQFIYTAFLSLWKMPISKSIQSALDIYKSSLEHGTMEYVTYSVVAYTFYSFLTGAFLEDLTPKVEGYIKFFKNVNIKLSSYWMIYLKYVLMEFAGVELNTQSSLERKNNEETLLKACKKANDGMGTFVFYLMHLITAYMLQNSKAAFPFIALAEKHLAYVSATLHFPIFYLFKALILSDLYSQVSFKEKILIRANLFFIQKKFKKWMRAEPNNFKNKYYIICAEIMRIKGKNQKAEFFYDNAIMLAQESGFLNEVALADELAAKFYLAQDKPRLARMYLQESLYAYFVWGANKKLTQLKAIFPDVLSEQGHYLIPTKTNNLHASSHSFNKTASSQLDIFALQKSSQAILSSIVLDDLLEKLIQIAVVNSGAQKGILILKDKNNNYVMAAETSTQGAKKIDFNSINEQQIPKSIINYVIHTKTSVVLKNAEKYSEKFEGDPYILTQRPKSILCVPLLNQNIVSGAIYLENNLVVSAFNLDRIQLIELFSAQMAISIDNSRLYADTKALNEQLTRINKAYERFVPKALLKLLGKESILEVKLGDQVQKDMTVLFADIRGFTTISENLFPEDIFKFINMFLKYMEPVITEYNGFIDKYIGDAIMALYPTNADDAVQCALNMLEHLEAFNEYLIVKEKFTIQIGIGINSGLLTLGIVGGENRMDGTVISDVVNVAARTQDLTKDYKKQLLITEETYQCLKKPEMYKIKFIAEIILRGKTQKTNLYSVEK